MEKLLNELIKKGWKPFGIKSDNIWLYCLSDSKIVISYYDFDTEGECNHEDKWCDLRQLTSKESGLWQFCTANHLLKKYSDLGDDDEYVIGRWQNGMDGKTTDGEYIDENYDSDIYHQDESYQYRLIESALCDEDKLEEFLLSNIKVDGTTK